MGQAAWRIKHNTYAIVELMQPQSTAPTNTDSQTVAPTIPAQPVATAPNPSVPTGPYKQTHVDYLPSITVVTRVQAMLEWSADNRIRLYSWTDNQWRTEMDVSVHDIKKIGYGAGMMKIHLRHPTATAPRKKFIIMMDQTAWGAMTGGIATRQAGIPGIVAEVVLAREAAQHETTQTDVDWWLSTFKTQRVRVSAYTAKQDAIMNYVIYGIGAVVLVIVLVSIVVSG